ncbi:MAG: methylated-DNA--[protein]-cysteine S-methyltransferase [Cellvibrionaceae bacterium]
MTKKSSQGPVFFDLFSSPVGEMIIVADEQGVRHLDFQDCNRPLPITSDWQRNPDFCQEARAQTLAYFAKELQHFDLPLAPQGTEFQKLVWQELATIPYGTFSTYGQMAKNMGRPTASRAIGMANGRNPLSIILPCHRVVGANRKLTGYRGGLPIKTFLLKLEGFEIDDQRLMA